MLEVLFEDESLIAIAKPAGLPSQQTPDPKRSHVLSELARQFPTQKFYLHHRLDKDTSGVLLLGKDPRVNAGLTEIFREHRLTKTYQCLCLRGPKSQVLKNGETLVQNHLAPVRASGKNLMRMVIVKKGGWFAETHLRLEETFQELDLFTATPKTGRTHQIRIHCGSLFRPIAGDSLYGGKSSAVPRLMLHAKSLRLVHPLTQKEILIESPLPADFSSVLTRLRKPASIATESFSSL